MLKRFLVSFIITLSIIFIAYNVLQIRNDMGNVIQELKVFNGYAEYMQQEIDLLKGSMNGY